MSFLAPVLVLGQIPDGRDVRARVAGVDDDRGIAAHLAQPARAGRDDRKSRGERLEHGEPEPLVQRREQQHVRGAVGTAQRGLVGGGDGAHPAAHPEAVHHVFLRGREAAAHLQQKRVRLLAQLRYRLHGERHVFSFDRAPHM